MIRLSVVDGDLLESRAEAILLPVDGTLPAGAGAALVQRSLGRIARAFAQRHPACELIDEIEAQVDFPLALGHAAPVELPDGSPFRFAILLSVLPHQASQTGEDSVRAAAGAAFAQALRLCDALQIGSVAAPLLKAGWRITGETALALMLRVLADAAIRHPVAVEIRVLDEPGTAARMRELARSFGIEVG